MLSFSLALVGLLTKSLYARTIEIPKWTGPYSVGVTQHVFNKTTLKDPFAPNNISHNYLATLYYPTTSETNNTIPYIPPQLATIYENLYSYATNSLANLTTHIQPNAPPHSTTLHNPTLIFGPGGLGPPSAAYQAFLTDLASYGYLVAALDHPYEQPFLQYPSGGLGIVGVDPTTPNVDYEAVYDVRIGDTLDFIRQFPSLVSSRFDTALPFNTSHFVLLGHSLGGAAAVGTLTQASVLQDTTFLGAINLDGKFWGSTASNATEEADAHKPVFLFGSQGHDPTTDNTWLTFPLSQSGWWREVNVKGSRHLDFSDVTFWKRLNASTSQSIGTINGVRITEIMSRYVREFVGFVCGGGEGVLGGGSVEFREVEFLGGS